MKDKLYVLIAFYLMNQCDNKNEVFLLYNDNEIKQKTNIKEELLHKYSCVIIILLFCIVLYSCGVTSYLTIDKKSKLFLTKVEVVSSYNEYSEIGAKQFLSLLGLSNEFSFSQGNQEAFALEQTLVIKPNSGSYEIDLTKNNEIILNDRLFSWKIYDRNSLFPSTKLDDNILKIVIKIDRDVLMANTTDIKNNIYTWLINYSQLQNGIEIKVFFNK